MKRFFEPLEDVFRRDRTARFGTWFGMVAIVASVGVLRSTLPALSAAISPGAVQKLSVYQGVITIAPGALGDNLLELGNAGRDIASSGEIFFRPSGTGAGSKISRSAFMLRCTNDLSLPCTLGSTTCLPGGGSCLPYFGMCSSNHAIGCGKNLDCSNMGAGTCIGRQDITVTGDVIAKQCIVLNGVSRCTWPSGGSLWNLTDALNPNGANLLTPIDGTKGVTIGTTESPVTSTVGLSVYSNHNDPTLRLKEEFFGSQIWTTFGELADDGTPIMGTGNVRFLGAGKLDVERNPGDWPYKISIIRCPASEAYSCYTYVWNKGNASQDSDAHPGIDADTFDSGANLRFTALGNAKLPKNNFYWKKYNLTKNMLCLKTNEPYLCVGGTNPGTPCSLPGPVPDPTKCLGGGTCTGICTTESTICPKDPTPGADTGVCWFHQACSGGSTPGAQCFRNSGPDPCPGGGTCVSTVPGCYDNSDCGGEPCIYGSKEPGPVLGSFCAGGDCVAACSGVIKNSCRGDGVGGCNTGNAVQYNANRSAGCTQWFDPYGNVVYGLICDCYLSQDTPYLKTKPFGSPPGGDICTVYF